MLSNPSGIPRAIIDWLGSTWLGHIESLSLTSDPPVSPFFLDHQSSL